jgi:hypothetical protein
MFVNAIYLKTPKRVQALGYVILMTVMIASLLEIRIREAMAKEKATISTGPRMLDRPTARVLLDMLNTIQVVYLTYDDHVERHLPHDIPPDVLRLLKFAGYGERIYLENPFRKPICPRVRKAGFNAYLQQTAGPGEAQSLPNSPFLPVRTVPV